MKWLIPICMLLIVSVSCYAQVAQENYTLLILEFEDRSGIENPLLAAFNGTLAFVLSRQTGPVQVHIVTDANRNALMARAAATQPDGTLSEQGLLAAELVDADALIMGSYTKQGGQWSLEAQVYHLREGSKTRQEIQIQADSLYQLLDDFPAHLLQQFKANYVALTTDSWKAYEEYRKGHEAFDQYNFLGALEHYEKALNLDPTLALAYAEQSYVYFMTGRADQATKSIEAAKQWLPKASRIEQLAIRVLDYGWDAERNEYTIGELINIAPGGVWDEVLIHRLNADICWQEGKQMENAQHHQLWIEAIQLRIRAHPEDASLLHNTAFRCLEIKRYVDEAIDMELKAVELNMKEPLQGPRYVLSRLYERKGDMEQALEWAKRSIQKLPDPRYDDNYYRWSYYDLHWHYLSKWLHDGKIPPERLLRWCEDVVHIPDLHLPYRVHAKYLAAEIYEFMNDRAKADAILVSLGAPRESDWMVIGALDAPMEDPFPESAPFDLLSDLTATHVGILGKEIQWEQWEDEQPMDGVIRICDVFQKRYYGQQNVYSTGRASGIFRVPSVAYSCIYAEVPTAMEVQMRTGAGRGRIWLNDNPAPVVENTSIWVAVPDIEINTIALKAGPNRFLVATTFGSCSFDLTFRITDKEGNAIPDLKYVSAKEVLASR